MIIYGKEKYIKVKNIYTHAYVRFGKDKKSLEGYCVSHLL